MMTTLLLVLASNIAVASILACVALMVGRSGRNAILAHGIWVAVFVKLITPPILPAPIPIPVGSTSPLAKLSRAFEADSNSTQTLVMRHNLDSQGVDETSARVNRGAHWRFGSLPIIEILLAIAAAGTAAIVIIGLVRFVRFSVILRRESLLDPSACEIVQSLVEHRKASAAMIRTANLPTVRLVRARISPMLFGIGRATCIVCPDRLWRSLSESERRAFLAHEVAHYLRRDHWVRWIEWLASAIYWWFPPIALARWQLERHEEAACDAWAISKLHISPRAYAETLLRVVDFLSNTKVCVPRLASPMQATDCLEERLRLIMTADQLQGKSSGTPWQCKACLAFCGLLLVIVHPFPQFVARASSRSLSATAPSLIVSDVVIDVDRHAFDQSDEWMGASAPNDRIPLPPVPRGWWNDTPSGSWADLKLENGLELLAQSGLGLELRLGVDSKHRFELDAIGAVAYVPSSQRLIVGNASGDVHLWDCQAMRSVSLIGRHRAAISTIAYHPVGGLVSGDCQGNLMAWDIQSGQILGAASVGSRIGAARWSSSGDELMVLAGEWSTADASSRLLSFRNRSLREPITRDVPRSVAVVVHDSNSGWLAVDWTGLVRLLSTGDPLWSIQKNDVSGTVLCQDLYDRVSRTPASNPEPVKR